MQWRLNQRFIIPFLMFLFGCEWTPTSRDYDRAAIGNSVSFIQGFSDADEFASDDFDRLYFPQWEEHISRAKGHDYHLGDHLPSTAHNVVVADIIISPSLDGHVSIYLCQKNDTRLFIVRCGIEGHTTEIKDKLEIRKIMNGLFLNKDGYKKYYLYRAR